jgi:hypothetical protein
MDDLRAPLSEPMVLEVSEVFAATADGEGRASFLLATAF